MAMSRSLFNVAAAILLLVPSGWSRDKGHHQASLGEYINRMQAAETDQPTTTIGSLWRDRGPLADLTADYKARRVGDVITILIVQDTTATNSANLVTDRSFKANSGIDALAGHISTSGVQNLFSPHSSTTLQGKGQASSKSSLRTALAGRVVAVLESGSLVVEAERSLTMNNERQTVWLRGVARPGDISPDNTIVSNDLAALELELKGKGVLSDGTRPPNLLVRLLLRLVGF
jgi:flagellar L-ring protein precursor FlgH